MTHTGKRGNHGRTWYGRNSLIIHTDSLFSVFPTNRTQGAMLSHVKPEDLLDYADYRRWQKIHRKLTGTNEEDSLSDNSASKFELAEFEAISAQAWTHILCQLIKVICRTLTCLSL